MTRAERRWVGGRGFTPRSRCMDNFFRSNRFSDATARPGRRRSQTNDPKSVRRWITLLVKRMTPMIMPLRAAAVLHRYFDITLDSRLDPVIAEHRRARGLATNRARDGRAVRHARIRTHRSPATVVPAFALMCATIGVGSTCQLSRCDAQHSLPA